MQVNKARATQDFIPIKEIRDNVVILKDGSMRAIIMTSSLNFALKSAENQEAIIYQFQTFLNSLDFSAQIYMESRRLDIRPYIALLEERYKVQQGDLLKLQTREYIDFVKRFTDETNIMTKTFFVVVPYASSSFQGKDVLKNKFLLKKGSAEDVKQQMDNFEEKRSQLEQRVSVVVQGLTRCGLRVVQLGTEEIVELFYKIFNPGETEKPLQVNQ
ncbi:MAG: hypothetical protein A3G52_00600 [Candidatus Taylorbacteria bacterium RIFCSPLOWO2_12_FULL_43_20]|uniref:TraC-like domain-containing protein n=1 Tax=Candidatus Taylorbacteria bacterium RIFCSPLOWO2_12_FULL_43_20 TaxID=1802332 RepID=A0A1G2P2V2_9BACT|nr:MAG: hypothetical protein A2825_00410 [Candidatus Taylorbacteria bacterium RIFCSPHIGHO2_01_FULL_43_120]OHA22746.1 MAG: hypothetical protein A3B98_01075 [Candidatus Taylorbacteria bacterium RIFCSPHIGHO2_02_FULL_43_55]OHA28656.1 MAG: hypothetical protein A3E92_01110 [Candidatus Taylorbacteria bacterium RIFCSPHIGHO2_12_FULL_42_34]OHA30663.1 MAG: hypothetical protein A3B09_00520 [Candidatus Taylorbacteria bacterium RIFCSPLOWO2_01_FULL_43_83]OHA38191.1 MAG: hypothetical protein A3H58_04455 [Candi